MKRCLMLITLLALCGCVKPVVLYVIDQEDIMTVKKGETIEAPKDGFFLSTFYVQEVMGAKVE